MMIDLITNMLEKIESLLGLPREFRIGEREGRQHGLFRRSEGFLEIAPAVIRREDAQGLPEDGKRRGGG
ncbi:7047ebb1-cdd5-496e-807f-0c89b17f72aa [Thermothielavioides terrestris]|uniref:7047ebb1-cdd5-496e-807f-0c89b17f72aa n=1 Tax=Thermothielavioides terrestris TaxID=2587410 RepID=A0A446BTA6_9PEZI|nr:7047ebb1-cdd5-496e-807f-0c89b17f72aa [Thermothielavioides terrestris]